VTIPGAQVTEAGGSWSATIPAAALAEGDNTISVSFEGFAQPLVATRVVRKDTVAPAAPTADLPAGQYDMPRGLRLGGENEVRYTTDGSAPSRDSVKFSGPISLTGDRTIKAVTIDAAGNLSAVATFSYTQKPAPAVEPVVVEKPVEVIREIVRLTPAQDQPAVVGTARIRKVAAPRSITLAKARNGVTMTVSTTSAALEAKADKGAKVRVSRRARGGFKVVFKATRKGAYKVTISLPDGASRVVSLKVR
jgi:hypothetical protein